MLTRSTMFIVLVLATTRLHGWNGNEHIVIGADAYFNACQQAQTLYSGSSDVGVRSRLALACTAVPRRQTTTASGDPRDTYAYESLFAEWCALAADHTNAPEQLTSIKLGDVVVDYRVFAKIVITNYRHFHPAVVSSWRESHFKAVQKAIAAAAAGGIGTAVDFEAALAYEAFAQHYVQDSFSSGHMGFNRVASSNAAALVYHSEASSMGRCVQNLRGDVWVTFGDDHLTALSTRELLELASKTKDDPRVRKKVGETARHVIAAATDSLTDFVLAFVSGIADASRWQAVWFQLPDAIKETVGAGEQSCSVEGNFHSLRTVGRPAESVSTVDVSTIRDATLDDKHNAVYGLMLGVSREYAFTIPVSYRVLQSRVYAAVGLTTARSAARAVLLDVGYLWHVGTSLSGTLTHELGLGEQWYFASRGNDRRAALRLLYACNIEVGRAYVRLQSGLSFGYGHWGPQVGAGVGWVQHSR